MEQLPEKISLDAERGTLVHSILETIHSLDRADRNIEKMKAIAPNLWREQIEGNDELQKLVPDEKEWLDRVFALLENYLQLEDPTTFDATHLEIHLESQVNENYLLHGYVDRLDIAPTGEVRIVDYKTGKAPQPRFADKAIFQLQFYGALYWRQTGVVPKLLQLLYLGDRQTIKNVPSERDLKAAEELSIKVGEGISASIRDDIWPTNPKKLCDWCSFKAICPAFTRS